jgi:hypothetical protein
MLVDGRDYVTAFFYTAEYGYVKCFCTVFSEDNSIATTAEIFGKRLTAIGNNLRTRNRKAVTASAGVSRQVTYGIFRRFVYGARLKTARGGVIEINHKHSLTAVTKLPTRIIK